MDGYTAFEGASRIVWGDFATVVREVKRRLGKAAHGDVCIFSDATGKAIDFDFHGDAKAVEKRLALFVDGSATPAAGPGRPKLGVVSREVSLLPRHWEWLAAQPGGASATLRQLVEAARKKADAAPTAKQIQERTYRFLSAMAGNAEGFEEALRALYKKDKRAFEKHLAACPADVRAHALLLSAPLFD